jgi:hypothetical protein
LRPLGPADDDRAVGDERVLSCPRWGRSRDVLRWIGLTTGVHLMEIPPQPVRSLSLIERSGRRAIGLLQVLVLLHVAFLQGCVRYRPEPLDAVPFRERLVYVSADGVRVGAASLGQRESRDLFGVALAREGIQPVWLEIDNEGELPVIFLQQSVDPAYFAPIEAAYKSHFSPVQRVIGFGVASILVWPLVLAVPFQYMSARSANARMNDVFVEHALGNRVIDPTKSAAGFVFTHLDEGTKSVRVVLLRRGGSVELNLVTEVPGAKLDHHLLDLETLYPDDQIEDLTDVRALGAALEQLPQVTTDKKGRGTGDPVNLVVLGDFDSLLEAFTRAGWQETEQLHLGSSVKTARSFLFGSEYRYSPTSDQYLFGRRQDVAFQRARASIHERNHLRLWYAPMRFAGQPIWVGQVNRDIGVKFTLRSWTLTTHAVDPDVDDARENVTGDLLHSGRLEYCAYLPGVGERTPDEPGRNLMNDPFHTDGRRAVYVLFDSDRLAADPGAFTHVEELH